MSLPKPQAGILEITPYVGGESHLPGVAKVIKLASNENPLGASPKAQAAYRDVARTLNRYPDGSSLALRAALAERHGIDPARIVCGNGSDELIGLLAHAFAGPGDEVMHTAHGFLMYAVYAKSAGATPVSVPETSLRADVGKLLDAVTDRTRILFLANPNNPTGTYLSKDELTALRAGLPEHVLLVIDGAYAEYVTEDDYGDGMALVAKGGNTVVTRTFSKIYGLSNLRLGWAYCPDNIADVLSRARSPFNVNGAALAAGVAALADREFEELSRTHNSEWVKRLTDSLRQLGLSLTDSAGNFVLATFPESGAKTAMAADDFLRSRGLIVRSMVGYGLPHALRITVGTQEENLLFLEAITTFMEGGS